MYIVAWVKGSEPTNDSLILVAGPPQDALISQGSVCTMLTAFDNNLGSFYSGLPPAPNKKSLAFSLLVHHLRDVQRASNIVDQFAALAFAQLDNGNDLTLEQNEVNDLITKCETSADGATHAP